MREVIAITLLAVSIVFFARNLHEMDAVAELAQNVRRKLYRLAHELHYVMLLNDEVIGQLRDNRESEYRRGTRRTLV